MAGGASAEMLLESVVRFKRFAEEITLCACEYDRFKDAPNTAAQATKTVLNNRI